MSEYVRELLVLIGGPVSVTAILVFVGRKLVESLSQRDLIKLKAELDVARIERESQLAVIQSRRAEVIAEFYDLLATAQMESARLVSILQLSGEPNKEEKWQRATDAAQAALEYFHRHRLFFDQETCMLVENIFDTIRSAHLDFGMSQDHDIKDRTAKWVQADNTMKNNVPKALHQLAESFRRTIGA